MKKISTILLAITLLSTNSIHAQNSSGNPPMKKNVSSDHDEFAWGVCLGALAVIGTIVGLTATSAASTPPTYSSAP